MKRAFPYLTAFFLCGCSRHVTESQFFDYMAGVHPARACRMCPQSKNEIGTSTTSIRLWHEDSGNMKYSKPSSLGTNGMLSPSESIDGTCTKSPGIRLLHKGPAITTVALVTSQSGADKNMPERSGSALAWNCSSRPKSPVIVPSETSSTFTRRSSTRSPQSLSMSLTENSEFIVTNEKVDTAALSMQLTPTKRGSF